MNKRKKVLAAGAIVLVAVGGASTVVAQALDKNGPPPRPGWVRADGTVDQSKMPARVGVLGPDGRPQMDAEGRERTVDPRSLNPLPAGPVPPPPGGAVRIDADGAASHQVQPNEMKRP